MLRLNTCIGLLTLLATISAEHYHVHHDEPPRVTGRLGFSILEQLRQSFCRTFCTSADTMPYFANLLCAAKCPELYLPHGTTTPLSTATPTSPGATSATSGIPASSTSMMPSVPGTASTTPNTTALNMTGGMG